MYERGFLSDISKAKTVPILLNHTVDRLDQFLVNCSWEKAVTSQSIPVIKVKHWKPRAKSLFFSTLTRVLH